MNNLSPIFLSTVNHTQTIKKNVSKPIESKTINSIQQVSEMKNPVDFKAFGKLQIVKADGTEHELSDEEGRQLGIAEFCQSYDFLNYLSQEEATTFLKQKEADRAEMLSHLFDLEKYSNSFLGGHLHHSVSY